MKIVYLFTMLGVFFSLCSTTAFAKGGGGGGGGGMAIGFGIGMMTASQDDLETHATAVNQAFSGRNAVKPGTGTEFSGFYEYRFSSSMFALHFQPSYFTQTGKGGTDTSTLTGLTLFPLLRLYPLENGFIHFYMQAGVGYGQLKGKIDQSTSGSVEFSGSAFGAMAGLGSQFCFTPSQCMYLEGNFRYLPIQRNLVSSSYSSTADGFSRSGSGQELELNNADVQTTLSGIIGSIGYQLNF